MRWRRTKTPSPDAARAVRSAEESHQQAQSDLAATGATLAESRRVKARIAQHNAANSYGEWLENVLVQARRRPT